jgi:predicted Fe-Mo cluster-binding NifX family protein
MAIALFSDMTTAISHWQGRISPVFDVADELLLVDSQGDRNLSRQTLLLSSSNPFVRAREMVDAGVQWLICGAISRKQEEVLLLSGIRVIGFTCGAVDAVLSALHSGSLNERRFRMPGSHGRTVRLHGRPANSPGPGRSVRRSSPRRKHRRKILS